MNRVSWSIGGVFIEGFLVLLPVLISYLLIGGFFDLLMSLTQPFIDVLPASAFRDSYGEQAAAALALVITVFVAGLLARSAAGRRLGVWTERKVLMRFPPYAVLRSFARRMFGEDVPDQLQPAIVEVAPESHMFAFVVEKATEDRFVVFVPLAPTAGVGTLRIVKSNRIDLLDASFSDAVGCLLNWGAGTAKLLERHSSSSSSQETGA